MAAGPAGETPPLRLPQAADGVEHDGQRRPPRQCAPFPFLRVLSVCVQQPAGPGPVRDSLALFHPSGMGVVEDSRSPSQLPLKCLPLAVTGTPSILKEATKANRSIGAPRSLRCVRSVSLGVDMTPLSVCVPVSSW